MTAQTDFVPGDFPSWRSYWNFAREVSRNYRYMRSAESEAFLAGVRATSESRRVEIPKGQIYFRAQVGHDWRPMNNDTDDEIPCAYPRARMKPLMGRPSDRRANPRGIPSLYLATTEEAAMSEVRPWIGSSVSCGQFKTNRHLTVIDCARRQHEQPLFFDMEKGMYEPAPEKRTQAVWAHIDRAFAEPTTRTDDVADYAPTQVLAELFKQSGADGVVYKSQFGDDGFNICLFDPDVADLINCGLFEVEAVKMKFKQTDDFYSVVEAAPPSTT